MSGATVMNRTCAFGSCTSKVIDVLVRGSNRTMRLVANSLYQTKSSRSTAMAQGCELAETVGNSANVLVARSRLAILWARL